MIGSSIARRFSIGPWAIGSAAVALVLPMCGGVAALALSGNSPSGDRLGLSRVTIDLLRQASTGVVIDLPPLAPAAPVDPSALLCLTQAIYYEAEFEPLAGRRAVAQVVLNRVRDPAYPNSVCAVVYERNPARACQFSFVCDRSLDRRPNPGTWREARAVARAALAGQVDSAVGAATHYHADYVEPRWAALMARTVKIGAHIFYRSPAPEERFAFTARRLGEPTSGRPALRPMLRPAGLPRQGPPSGRRAAPEPQATELGQVESRAVAAPQLTAFPSTESAVAAADAVISLASD